MIRRFNEWLVLRESVTIVVKDADYPQQTGSIMDLGFALSAKIPQMFMSKLTPQEKQGTRFHEMFANDGDDFYSPTGIINFYVGNLLPETIKKMTQAAIYFLGEMGAVVDQSKITMNTYQDKADADINNIRKWGDDDPNDPDMDWSDEYPPKTVDQKIADYRERMKGAPEFTTPHLTRVVRIPVVKRTSGTGRQGAPDINISNQSADNIFRNILNFPADYLHQPMAIRDLLIKIGHLPDFNIGNNVIQPAGGTGQGGARFYDGGHSEEQIRRTLERIEELCQWAIKNGYEYLDFH